MGDLIGLGILWNDTLAAIIIQGHTNSTSLLTSKFPIITIVCLLVNHDWTTKGSNRGGLIIKSSSKILLVRYLWIKGGLAK